MQLNPYLTSLMQKHKVFVCSYALIDQHKIIAHENISIHHGIKIPSNPLFQACSFSKCLTAYAILDLSAQHKIHLDQSINQQLVNWKIPPSQHSEKITVRECLNMSSGLFYGKRVSQISLYEQHQILPKLKSILDGEQPAKNLPIVSIDMPGTDYVYCGASYMVLQQLIEDITQQTFISYMNKKILPFFHMAESIFDVIPASDLCPRIVSGFDEKGFMNEEGWYPNPYTASGGLWSNALDMAKFILEISHYKEMVTSQAGHHFGLGIVLEGGGENFNFRKNGHNSGYHHQFIFFPESGQGIVVMTNQALGISLIQEFIATVVKAYQWPFFSSAFHE